MKKLWLVVAATVSLANMSTPLTTFAQDTDIDDLFEAPNVSAQATVPVGEYVFSDNPPVGRSTSFIDNMDDPTFVASVGRMFGPKAAATVVFVSQANKLLHDCGGGDACRYMRQAAGISDHSSGAGVCVRTPAGTSLISVVLSNRHGQGAVTLSRGDAFTGVASVSTGDYSGWQDVRATRTEDGRVMVCGIGTNWSSDQEADKIITINYY